MDMHQKCVYTYSIIIDQKLMAIVNDLGSWEYILDNVHFPKQKNKELVNGAVHHKMCPTFVNILSVTNYYISHETHILSGSDKSACIGG